MDIQKLIDDMSQNGGGIVTVNAGKYVTGTIILKDNVTLNLEEGANIIGSEKIEDYPLPINYFYDAMGEERGRALVYADGAKNIGIIGKGVINGCGGTFIRGREDYAKRPFLVRLLNCENVKFEDVELREAAAWTCHLQGCTDVIINNMKIDSFVNANNDGIDVDSCQNIKITNCNIYTGDDAVCIKATLAKACENVEVANCTLYSDCATLKLGTESYGDMTNIYMHDCKITHAGLGALKILSSDGAIMKNIKVDNIVAENTTGPILIRLGDRGNIYDKSLERRVAGGMENVEISNFSSKVTLPEEGPLNYWTKEIMPTRSLSCICISGQHDAKIDSIKFTNLNIEFMGLGIAEDRDIVVADGRADYPEIHHLGILPASCFYLRHINNIEFDNVQVKILNADERDVVVTNNVANCIVNNCNF